MERHEVQAFVRQHRKHDVGFFERKLWDLAQMAPLGGSLPGGTVEDPYLLRVYLSPRDPQFRWLWETICLCTDLGEYDATVFQGVPHLYLHHFFRGDADVEVHNHPWRFSVSLILTGGYVEERWDATTETLQTRHLYPGDVNVIRHDDFHRVTLKDAAHGCWTLFLSSDRLEEKNGTDWGFMHPQSRAYTAWGPFLAQRRQQPASAA